MKAKFTLYLSVILIFFSSCAKEIMSNDVPTDKILVSYEAHCQNGIKTYVTAHVYTEAGLTIPPFRKPYGRPVTLQKPSKIFCNGVELKYSADIFNDVSYKTEFEGWPTEFHFEWIDKDGKSHKDFAQMDEIYLNTSKTIKIGKLDAFKWQGSPVRANEEVSIIISSGESSDDNEGSLISTNEIGKDYVVIPNSDFPLSSKYYPQSITRTLMQRKTKEISTENVAGSVIKLVYRDK